MSVAVRNRIIERLREDLLGPTSNERECIDERPTERYLSGILYPCHTHITEEEDEKLDTEIGKGVGEGNEGQNIALTKTRKPAAAGLSFAVSNKTKEKKIEAEIICGIYRHIWEDENGNQFSEKVQDKKLMLKWQREPLSKKIIIDLSSALQEIDLTEYGYNNLKIFIKTSDYEHVKTVTLQAYNSNRFSRDDSFITKEEGHFFQFKLKIVPIDKTIIIPRPVKSYINDEDARIGALIYRNTKEYACGHMCAAIWDEDEEGNIKYIGTEWIPEQRVLSVDSDGDEIFKNTFESKKIKYPDAEFLSKESRDSCIQALSTLVDAFENWVLKEEKKILSIDDKVLKAQAEDNVKTTKKIAIERMRNGIDLIKRDDFVFESFQLANRAMQLPLEWKAKSNSNKPILKWRPFQLAFCLMALQSSIDNEDPYRDTMDLIWFPTGGGKTEAYLLLTAFILFYRRISAENLQDGYGVAVFMRYTLRTLTIQQFERASSLICACECIRKQNPDKNLGDKRFSIGLWVGQKSTPNNYDQAYECLSNHDESTTPAQLKRCPACDAQLLWGCDDTKKRVIAACPTSNCLEEIPVHTIDSEIYEELPSLLIGTVDKFAQIARKTEAVKLFGVHTPHNPPDLIIQDELHLISGPLGTLTGLYEVAVDKFCSSQGKKPKVIGSTATIRRAKQQIKSLFCRDAYQFPPPIIDADNSCFAKLDKTKPGRIYLGVTTAGRSEKYVLQAVAASLLQSIMDENIKNEDLNYFSTLVAYFNSLRVLGGALVVMQDDVDKTLQAYAERRKEQKREISAPEEMTSRKNSKEIPEILERLSFNQSSHDFIDVLLATNMLSVGVDIPRLGLMLVNGQPKTMSEYIQATSRVGRQSVPGLIVTTYNNNKPRDRAHYESFKTWHQSLYRDIEGSSVTPFAARARDKALHAILITLARHLIPQLNQNPVLTSANRQKIEDEIIPYILQRLEMIDPRELEDTEGHLKEILDYWEEHTTLKYYWKGMKNSLLVSADDVAQLYAVTKKKLEAIPTPNNMRNVEAQSMFFLKETAKEIENRLREKAA